MSCRTSSPSRQVNLSFPQTKIGIQVKSEGFIPACGGNGKMSCLKTSLLCHKHPWEGVLHKLLK